MIALLLAAAWACDVPAAIAVLTGGPGELKEAYLCVAEADDGGDRVVTALDTPAAAAPPPTADAPLPTATDADMVHARLTRALAVWLLQHADAQWDPALVRRLPAADRRLLSDGIRARRGRASPSPDHAKVFANFAWYVPSPAYTDGRLSAIDRANIAMADKPPPPPPPPPPVPPAAPEAPATVASGGWCGCATGAGPRGWALLPLLGLVVGRRRLPAR